VPFVYHAGAGWTGNGGFSRKADWTNYLRTFAQRLQTPLAVTLTRGH
jgi:hypothetical protein